MLNLNIKSSSYMCLDIDPDSVIHKHLVKKLYDLDEDTGSYEYYNYVLRSLNNLDGFSKHDLIMLPNFHISLGKPPPNSEKSIKTVKLERHEFHELVGVISLADIHVSKKENKKSAWISINDTKFSLATQIPLLSYMHTKHLHLHISLANLTGNRHDSIARPEDCIIDTITA